jgi:hypothetical protein
MAICYMILIATYEYESFHKLQITNKNIHLGKKLNTNILNKWAISKFRKKDG